MKEDMQQRLRGRLLSNRRLLAEHIEVELKAELTIAHGSNSRLIIEGEWHTEGAIRAGDWKGTVYLPAPEGAALIDRLWAPVGEPRRCTSGPHMGEEIQQFRRHDDACDLQLWLNDGRTGRIAECGTQKLTSGEAQIMFEGRGPLHWRNPWLYVLAVVKGRQRTTLLGDLATTARWFWRLYRSALDHINNLYASGIRRKLLTAIARGDRINISWCINFAWGRTEILSPPDLVHRIPAPWLKRWPAGLLELHTYCRTPRSAMELAVWLGDAVSVDMLIRAGADAARNQTPFNEALVTAVRAGREDIVRLLIEAGVAVNNTFNEHSVPPHLAYMFPKRDREREGWGDTTACIEAASYPSIMRLLLDSGAHANQQCAGGKTALMKAAVLGCADSVRVLLQAGADVEKQDDAGGTALMDAVLHAARHDAYVDTVLLLLEHGASVQTRTKQGLSALHFSSDNPKVLALLERYATRTEKLSLTQRRDVYTRAITHACYGDIQVRSLPAVSFRRIDLNRGTDKWTNLPAFEVGVLPVTQALAEMVHRAKPFLKLGSSFSHLPSGSHPWIATWPAAVAFCNSLSLMHGFEPCYPDPQRYHVLDCKYEHNGFRLPMEVEWEFAALGFCVEEGRLHGTEAVWRVHGWFPPENGNEIKPVGGKMPNPFGLQDMLGNGYEWCDEAWEGSPSARVAKGWETIQDITERPFGLKPLPMTTQGDMTTFRVVRRPQA